MFRTCDVVWGIAYDYQLAWKNIFTKLLLDSCGSDCRQVSPVMRIVPESTGKYKVVTQSYKLHFQFCSGFYVSGKQGIQISWMLQSGLKRLPCARQQLK